MIMYAGGFRLSGGKWQAVVITADEAAAWRVIRQYVEQLNAKVIDTYVGHAGVDLNHRQGRFP